MIGKFYLNIYDISCILFCVCNTVFHSGIYIGHLQLDSLLPLTHVDGAEGLL